MPRDNSRATSTGVAQTDQLDLFPSAVESASRGVLSAAAARASVSPGWWHLIHALFAFPGEIDVHECREAGGQLLLEATLVEGRAPSHASEFLLQGIRDACARTCGCCSASDAAPWWDSGASIIRVVCAKCRQEIAQGRTFSEIADEHFRFDGFRRPRFAFRAPDHSVEREVAERNDKRACTQLGPDELRRTIGEIRRTMSAQIVGQSDAVAHLALLAGLHVGGGMARGGRALIIGPSGVGKTSLIQAMRQALEQSRWDVPFVVTDLLDLTSPGWSGAPSIGDLLEAAFDGAPPNSARARHAVVVVDELHHARVADGLHGNMRAKREEVLGSLLPLLGHGTLHLGEGAREWSSRDALVIGMGAFTGLLSATRLPTPADLVAAGLPLELSTRFEETILLHPLAERPLVELLHQWPALTSLTDTCNRLGYAVTIHEETYRRAARAVIFGNDASTRRTAGGWIVSALRRALIAALGDDSITELTVTPDSLSIARASARRRPPDDPPEWDSGWDATLILTPR